MADETNAPQDSGGPRPRRSSITASTFGTIFGRTNVPNGAAGTPSLPTPISTAASGRRMSITTLGLSGTSPSQATAFFPIARRTSISTSNSDSIDESVIEDEDGPGRSVPATPLGRRMSLGAQALLNPRSGEGLNWSEQFRSRAESVVTRPAVSTSPTTNTPRSPPPASHERAKSVSDMPAPPTNTIPTPRILKEDSALRRKPDAVGERILRGEFHMD